MNGAAATLMQEIQFSLRSTLAAATSSYKRGQRIWLGVMQVIAARIIMFEGSLAAKNCVINSSANST